MNPLRLVPITSGDSDFYQFRKIAQELQIVFDRLAEADAGIHQHSIGTDAGALGRIDPLLKESCNVKRDILIIRPGLHRRRLALHVHENDRRRIPGN